MKEPVKTPIFCKEKKEKWDNYSLHQPDTNLRTAKQTFGLAKPPRTRFWEGADMAGSKLQDLHPDMWDPVVQYGAVWVDPAN
jgi:hypothetical protein